MDLKSKEAIEVMIVLAIVFVALYALIFSFGTPTGESRLPVVVKPGPGGGPDEGGPDENPPGSPGDTTPPIVSIVSPNEGSSIASIIDVTVNASDVGGISNVKFFVDNFLMLEDNDPPYKLSWNTAEFSANGLHEIKVVAFDKANNSASDSAIITVNNTPPTDKGVLFVAHFDESTNADFALGSVFPDQNSGTTIVPGKYGNGVLVDGNDKLYYSSKGNFDLNQGTVELWFKPNWPANDGFNHTFFAVRNNDDDYFQFDKHNIAGFNYLYSWSECGRVFPCGDVKERLNGSNWEQNLWQHIAVTWGNNGRVLYLDGNVVDKDDYFGPALFTLPTTFGVGINPWNNGSERANGVIDELRISNIELSPEDIRNSAGLNPPIDNIPPNIEILNPTEFPSFVTTTSNVYLSGYAFDSGSGINSISYDVFGPNNSLIQNGVAVYNEDSNKWWFNLFNLPVGDNSVIVTAIDNADNKNYDKIRIKYLDDDLPPTITILTPTSNPNYSTIQSSVILTGTAIDSNSTADYNTGIKQVYFDLTTGGKSYFGGRAVLGQPSASFANWKTDESIPLNRGTTIITMHARDVAGNIGNDTITITNNTLGPRIGIMWPTYKPNYSTKGSTISLRGFASFDAWKVTYSVNGSLAQDAGGTTDWNISNVPLNPGKNTIRVTVCDFACNNSRSDTITVTRIAHSIITYNLGDKITGLKGIGQYNDKNMVVYFTQLTQTNNPDIFNATFELWDDSSGILVDTVTVGALTKLNGVFRDDVGDFALKTYLLVINIEGIVNSDGTFSGYVGIIRDD